MSASARYRIESQTDGVHVIDTQDHRSVVLAWDRAADLADDIQIAWNRHWASDLPLAPTTRTDLCPHPHVLQAGVCCERSPCRLHGAVRVLEVVGSGEGPQDSRSALSQGGGQTP